MTTVDVAPARTELRALERIAEHCASLDRLAEPRAPAGDRLEDELGRHFAGFLVGALRGRPSRHTGWLAA